MSIILLPCSHIISTISTFQTEGRFTARIYGEDYFMGNNYEKYLVHKPIYEASAGFKTGKARHDLPE